MPLASITASARADMIIFIVRIESSFAGIGYVTLFGSVLESTIAIVGISSLLASLIAVSSYCASTITTNLEVFSYP